MTRRGRAPRRPPRADARPAEWSPAAPLQDLQADPALPIARLPEASVVLDATVAGYDPEYGLTTLTVDRRNDHRARRLWRPGNAAARARRRVGREPRPSAARPQHDPQCSSRPRGGGRAAGCRADERRGPAGRGRAGRTAAGARHPEVLGGRSASGQAIWSTPRSRASRSLPPAAASPGRASLRLRFRLPRPRRRFISSWRERHEDQRAQRA